MSMVAVLLVAQAISTSTVQTQSFYVAGVRQDMTMADYNSLISNGGYKSKPVGPDVFWATIEGQDVVVSFCQGRVYRAMASYTSVDWARSLTALQGLGIKWGSVYPSSGAASDASTVAVASIMPLDFRYSITPLVKGFTVGKSDFPTFQLSFEALQSPCRGA